MSGKVDRTAYTVGYAEGYDRSLAEATETDPMFKVVRHDDYLGGWVWRNRYSAAAFLRSDGFEAAFPGRRAEFAVYLLELPAGWGDDVYGPHPKDAVHHLVNDARVVRRCRGVE